MKYKIGRNNLAATIYVPYDCDNNCPFCTSKIEYRQHFPNIGRIVQALKSLVDNPLIQDIVFTGGEPLANMTILKMLVDITRKKGKNVFINTTFPKDSHDSLFYLLEEGNVSGINISRHESSYEQDSKLFYNIAPDWLISKISVPVKINAVVTNVDSFITKLPTIINRWNKPNIRLCIRHDFRTTTFTNLHTLTDDPILNYLIQNYSFESHTFCDVCDTVNFEEGISYHRGMEHSSIKMGDTVIVNDIIVFPDGFIAYDWDRKPISDLKGFMDLGDFMTKTFKEKHEKTIQSNNQNTEKITNGYVGEYLGCGQYRRCEYLGCGVYNYSPSCRRGHC